jgi:hypothetical protein
MIICLPDPRTYESGVNLEGMIMDGSSQKSLMWTLKTCEVVTFIMIFTCPVTLIVYKPACFLLLVNTENFPYSTSNCIESI